MKIIANNTKQLLFSLILLVSSYSSAGTTYTSIENGTFNDPMIWSTDGGVTNCNCFPAMPSNGVNIVVNHAITLNDHLNINAGSNLTVNAAGSLYGPGFNLVAWGGSTVEIYGPSTFNKMINGLVNGTNGASILISGTIVEFNGRVILYAGVTNISGGYMYLNLGNFDTYESAVFNVTGGSKLELFAGNITNRGSIDICAECCLTTKGNWTNESTGSVTGYGSATTSVGNMKNFNFWSLDITWCSAGFDTGMPSNEDCSSSNQVCGAVALPVELVSFEGANHGDFNDINWETASEINSDYFILLRSYDGYNWREVTQVSAAGESTVSHYYNFRDSDFQKVNPIVYYRLEQVDTDGKRNISAIISISNNLSDHDLFVYPNPVGDQNVVHITGTEFNGELSIFSGAGEPVHATVQFVNGQYEVYTSELRSGMYFIEHTNEYTGEIQRGRFIVR